MHRKIEHDEDIYFGETALGKWLIRSIKKFKSYFAKRGHILILNTLVGLVLVSTLIGLYFVTSAKVFEIYVDGEKIGYVSDKQLLDNWQEESYNEAKSKYGDWQLTLSSTVFCQPSRKLFVHDSDEKVLDRLVTTVSYDTTGVAILVDGKAVGVVNNKEIAARVVNDLKSDYMKNKNEYGLAAADSADNKNEQIIGIGFKETINYQNIQVSPDQVLSEEEMQAFLRQGTVEKTEYLVQKGDSVSGIADKFNLSVSELRSMNPQINDRYIQTGEALNVTAYKPPITVHIIEHLTQTETIAYPVDYTYTSSMFVNESRTITRGVNGEKIVDYEIVKENGIIVEKTITNEEITKEPVRAVVSKGTKPVPTRGSGILAWPVNGGYISSGYGPRWGSFHSAIDIAGTSNRTVKAADNGVVVQAGWYGGYGNCVTIDHGNGIKTLYAHLSSISVSRGSAIAKGQQIGIMGSTGYSYGVHLHFEVIVNGVKKNPINYVGT